MEVCALTHGAHITRFGCRSNELAPADDSPGGPWRRRRPPASPGVRPGDCSGRFGGPVRLGRLSWGCEQIGWLPNPPCHQGVCVSTLMGRHKTATSESGRLFWQHCHKESTNYTAHFFTTHMRKHAQKATDLFIFNDISLREPRFTHQKWAWLESLMLRTVSQSRVGTSCFVVRLARPDALGLLYTELWGHTTPKIEEMCTKAANMKDQMGAARK